jgi:hypothetical protein
LCLGIALNYEAAMELRQRIARTAGAATSWRVCGREVSRCAMPGVGRSETR